MFILTYLEKEKYWKKLYILKLTLTILTNLNEKNNNNRKYNLWEELKSLLHPSDLKKIESKTVISM